MDFVEIEASIATGWWIDLMTFPYHFISSIQ